MAEIKDKVVTAESLLALHEHIKNTYMPNVNIVELIYPVGSIYMSVNDNEPSILFGGTWEQMKDRFLLGAGSTYSNGATGGEETHTLTLNEMPSHTHSVPLENGAGAFGNDTGGLLGTSYGYKYTDYQGGGAAHNNMPPYLVVYMWKRTA